MAKSAADIAAENSANYAGNLQNIKWFLYNALPTQLNRYESDPKTFRAGLMDELNQFEDMSKSLGPNVDITTLPNYSAVLKARQYLGLAPGVTPTGKEIDAAYNAAYAAGAPTATNVSPTGTGTVVNPAYAKPVWSTPTTPTNQTPPATNLKPTGPNGTYTQQDINNILANSKRLLGTSTPTPTNQPATGTPPGAPGQAPPSGATPTGTQPGVDLGTQLNIQRNLMPGMTGEDVKSLQNYLIQQGYDIPAGATGYYGPQTKAAVEAFQRKSGIQPKSPGDYGYFGPISRAFGGTATHGTTTGTTGTTTETTTETLSPAQTEYKGFLQQQDFQTTVDNLGKQLGLDTIKQSITDANKQLLDLRDKKAGEAADINNNPWISETLRVNKLKNLEGKYEQREANLRDAIQVSQRQYENAVQEIQFVAKLAIEQANEDRQYDLKVKEFAASLLKEKSQPASVQEYEYAKSQGYKGSYSDYQNEDANRKRSIAAAGVNGLSPYQTNQAFINLSNKYQADPIINQALNGRTASTIADQIIANPGSTTNQLASLYLLVKNLDPTSAVREGELGLAQQTQSYLQKYETSLTRIAKGQVISPQAAKDLATATKTLVTAWNATADRRQKQYSSQAQIAGVGQQFSSYLGGFESGFTPPTPTSVTSNSQLSTPIDGWWNKTLNWLGF